MSRTQTLQQLLGERIVILDGAMGTMVQKRRLTEEDYRGSVFADRTKYPHDVLNNNDLLVLTQPDVIGDIHRAYLDAGADIITTCTFSSTCIGQHEFFHTAPPGPHDRNYYEGVLADGALQ